MFCNRFFSFFAPMGSLGLIIVWHLPKSLAMPQYCSLSGKNTGSWRSCIQQNLLRGNKIVQLCGAEVGWLKVSDKSQWYVRHPGFHRVRALDSLYFFLCTAVRQSCAGQGLHVCLDNTQLKLDQVSVGAHLGISCLINLCILCTDIVQRFMQVF